VPVLFGRSILGSRQLSGARPESQHVVGRAAGWNRRSGAITPLPPVRSRKRRVSPAWIGRTAFKRATPTAARTKSWRRPSWRQIFGSDQRTKLGRL